MVTLDPTNPVLLRGARTAGSSYSITALLRSSSTWCPQNLYKPCTAPQGGAHRGLVVLDIRAAEVVVHMVSPKP